MFRTVDDIQNFIIAQLAAVGIIVPGAKFSKRRLTTRIFAEAGFLFIKLLATHKKETRDMVAILKPGTLTWYKDMLLKFQYGSSLVTDRDYYDNSNLTDSQVAAQQIIKQAAATVESGIIVLKALKNSGGLLVKLNSNELTALTSYVNEFNYAGDDIEIRSFDPDKIKLKATVKYNPEILLPSGARIDGQAATPVQDAIKAFLLNTSFNGTYIKQKHQDYVEEVEGVNNIEFDQVLASRYTATSMQSIYMNYQPFSGALRFYNDLDIELTFIPGM